MLSQEEENQKTARELAVKKYIDGETLTDNEEVELQKGLPSRDSSFTEKRQSGLSKEDKEELDGWINEAIAACNFPPDKYILTVDETLQWWVPVLGKIFDKVGRNLEKRLQEEDEKSFT